MKTKAAVLSTQNVGRTPDPTSWAYRMGQRTANGVAHTSNAGTYITDTVAQAWVDYPADYKAQRLVNGIKPVAPRTRS